MELLHARWDEADESTIADIRADSESAERRICRILEDQFNEPKILGESRFPPGRYQIKLRTDSPKYAHYWTDDWTKDWFKGMPWLQDVQKPDGSMSFTFVYYHPGLNDDHSAGCGLTGFEYHRADDGNYTIVSGTTRPAFKKLCLLIYEAMDRGEEVWVTVTDPSGE